MNSLHILVSNDDGIHAQGIRVLATYLATFARVTVVAPDRPQSASSHGITLHKPLYAEKADLGEGIRAYQVNGTPADCVKLGLGTLCHESVEPVDLVLSGINAGSNLGHDIVYSGTAAAASEGALLGFPAIALSLTGEPYDFMACAKVARLLIDQFVLHGLPKDTYLNVNVPPGGYEELTGIEITRTGVRQYQNDYTKRVDPLGRSYYWQAGEIVKLNNEPGTDVYAVEQHRVSVTPVTFDFTNDRLLDTLGTWHLSLG